MWALTLSDDRLCINRGQIARCDKVVTNNDQTSELLVLRDQLRSVERSVEIETNNKEEC